MVSEAPPHLLFTWQSNWGSELPGCALLLGRDDVAVQDDFFCQQPAHVAHRRQIDIVFVREGADFTCFLGERVMRTVGTESMVRAESMARRRFAADTADSVHFLKDFFS